jgi:Protein of unknown function (DUF616)
MNVLVYSAVFGGYDQPKTHVSQNVQAEYRRFSEENDLFLPDHMRELHPRLLAKYYKMQPYVMPDYAEYDYVVWIDGSGALLAPDSLRTLIGCCGKGYTVFKHPERDCIYDEAAFCRDYEKYRTQPILQQVDAYRRAGYPAHNGLYACGLIVRDTRKDYKALDSAWLQENLRWSYQDQLSFPYLLWKLGIQVDVIDLPLNGNGYVSFTRDQWTK